MCAHNSPDCFEFEIAKEESLLRGSFQSLLELINSTACVNEFLLTGKEGMTFRANFNSHFSAICGLGCNGLAASTLDGHFFVIRMDSGLHLFNTSLYKYSQWSILYHSFFKNARDFTKKMKKFSKIIAYRRFLGADGRLFSFQDGKYRTVKCRDGRQPPFASARHRRQAQIEARRSRARAGQALPPPV